MLQRENLEANKNTQLNETLLELKASLYNPVVAADARRLAAQTREPFDALKYEEYLEQHPSFKYFHLVAPSDE